MRALRSGYKAKKGGPMIELLSNALSLFILETGPALYFWPEQYVLLTWVGAIGLGWAVRALFGVAGRGDDPMTTVTVMFLWIYPWLSVGVCFMMAREALGIPPDALVLAIIPTMLVGGNNEAMYASGVKAGIAMNAVAVVEMVAQTSPNRGVAVMPLWSVVLGARYLACAPSWPSFVLRAALLGWRSFTGIGILAVAELFASSYRGGASMYVGGVCFKGSIPERVILLVAAWDVVLLMGEWTPAILALAAILEVPMLFFW